MCRFDAGPRLVAKNQICLTWPGPRQPYIPDAMALNRGTLL